MRICSLREHRLKHEWNQMVWSVNNLRCGTAALNPKQPAIRCPLRLRIAKHEKQQAPETWGLLFENRPSPHKRKIYFWFLGGQLATAKAYQTDQTRAKHDQRGWFRDLFLIQLYIA